MNSSKKIQEAVGGYFKDPSGTSDKVGTSATGTGENAQLSKSDMSKLKEQLQAQIRSINDLEKLRKNIEMTVTAEGLRVEMLESENGTFFNSGSSQPNASGRELLSLLAKELGDLPNRVSIEGHTDAKPYPGKRSYSNWELSADRANAARRLMQESGLRNDQVSQIRGFADQRLRTPNDPLEASNRRISIIVQYLANNQAPEQGATAEGSTEKKVGSEAD
jgi:chemotaxis protein MotB